MRSPPRALYPARVQVEQEFPGAATLATSPRLGVVLAAGRSERLAEVTSGRSKALIRLGGLTLVERAVRTLLASGVSDVLVVVGFQGDAVGAAATAVSPCVRSVRAGDWELGNGASMAAAGPFVGNDELFVLVTADHIFSDAALRSLVLAGTAAVLVDHAPEQQAWAEGTRVRLEGERATAFSKELGDPSIDCGAFLLPASVFAAQRQAQAAGDASLAGAVTQLVETTGITAVGLPPGSWWQDVDTPEDLGRVRRRLRSSLSKHEDGPVSQHLNRPLSTRLSMAVSRFRPPPDVISIASFAIAVLAAWAVSHGAGIAGGIGVQVASITDGMDGELARLQMRVSARGALLDGVLDRLGDATIIAAMAVWALTQGHDPTLTACLAVAAAVGSTMSMAVKDRASALGLTLPREPLVRWLLAGRDGRLLISAVSCAVGAPLVGLAITMASSTILLISRVLRIR
jgi:choline kinase/phosphatidylglycerophosphate synthase